MRALTSFRRAFFDPELILKSARALDAVPAAERGSLHGICVGVKDVFLTKDQPTQYNSAIYKDSAPAIDAASVQALRSAGALVSRLDFREHSTPLIPTLARPQIFGKTHTTEFATCQKGSPACNPHDPTRTPGGSSSGSGAAVGDFQCTIALGSTFDPCPPVVGLADPPSSQLKLAEVLFDLEPTTGSTRSSRPGTPFRGRGSRSVRRFSSSRSSLAHPFCRRLAHLRYRRSLRSLRRRSGDARRPL